MKAFLLRKEHFGGTLFSVKSGKRVYVSMDEFQLTEEYGIIPEHLSREMGEAGEVRIVYPCMLPELGFSSPDTIFFEVTHACNLSCKHCFNNSGRRMDGEIECEKQTVIIRECAKFGVQEVRLTGGEPMFFGHIYDLIYEASRNNLRVSIGTNGTLITRENARRLSACGLNVAIVSVDGVEKSNDAIRGLGNFQKSIDGILNLREQGISVRVNIVAMKLNIKDIFCVVELFHKLGVSIFVRRFIPLGRSADVASDFSLSLGEYERLKTELKMYLDDSTGVVRGHYLKEEYVGARIELPFIRRSCSAGQRALVINPCGNVQLCGFMSQKSTNFFGNIMDESLSQIWYRIIMENPIGGLARVLEYYNTAGENMVTNCFAIALACYANKKGDRACL